VEHAVSKMDIKEFRNDLANTKAIREFFKNQNLFERFLGIV
jgi:uncharacterized membrane protein